MDLICLLAQGPKPAGSPFDRPDLIIGTAGLAGALLVGALLIFLVDRWRKRASLADVAGAELTSFRAMYERGEITEEEYARLRNKVSERVSKPAEPPVSAGPRGQAESGRTGGPAPAAGGPYLPGPLPAEYFEDPQLSDPPPGSERPPGESPPPA